MLSRCFVCPVITLSDVTVRSGKNKHKSIRDIKLLAHFLGICLFLLSWQAEGLMKELKKLKAKTTNKFLRNSREADSCQHTAEHLRGHRKTLWRTHTMLLTVHPHKYTKNTHKPCTSGRPLGSPLCRSVYMGNIIVPQLCPSLQHSTQHIQKTSEWECINTNICTLTHTRTSCAC